MLAGSDHGGRILLSKQTPAPLLPEKNEGEMAMLLSRNMKKIFGPGLNPIKAKTRNFFSFLLKFSVFRKFFPT